MHNEVIWVIGNDLRPVIPVLATSEIPGDVISGRGCTVLVKQLNALRCMRMINQIVSRRCTYSNRVQEKPAASGEMLFTLSLNCASPPVKVVQPSSIKAMSSHVPPKLTSVQTFTDLET